MNDDTLILALTIGSILVAALIGISLGSRLVRKNARVLQSEANHPLIVPVENKTATQMSVMLEPSTFTIELEPGQMAEIVMPSPPKPGDLQIDYFDEQFLSVWVPADASIRIRKD